jgi:hypothetical protein
MTASAELVLHDAGKDALQLRKTIGPGKLGNGLSKNRGRGVVTPLVKKLPLELGNVNGHVVRS